MNDNHSQSKMDELKNITYSLLILEALLKRVFDKDLPVLTKSIEDCLRAVKRVREAIIEYENN